MSLIKFEAQEFEGFSYTPGDYIGLIDSITPGKTQSGKRKYDLTLVGDGFGKITHPIYDSVFGKGELFKIYTALGIDPTRKDVDDTELIDNYIAFTIVEEEYNGKPTYKVRDFREVESADVDSEDNDDDDW